MARQFVQKQEKQEPRETKRSQSKNCTLHSNSPHHRETISFSHLPMQASYSINCQQQLRNSEKRRLFVSSKVQTMTPLGKRKHHYRSSQQDTWNLIYSYTSSFCTFQVNVSPPSSTVPVTILKISETCQNTAKPRNFRFEL